MKPISQTHLLVGARASLSTLQKRHARRRADVSVPRIVPALAVGVLLLGAPMGLAQTPLPDDFDPGANGWVGCLAVQADGKILLSGSFTALGGQPRKCVGRLNATDPATQSLSFDGLTITWLRGGTSPEVWRTTFDWSSDGQQWTSLGDGTRIPGGRQQTNAVVPVEATIRARGFIMGGAFNSSGWFVEALMTYRPLAPHIAGVSLVGGGNIRFTGSGPSGAGCRVLAATNLGLSLGDWLQIGSGVFTGGVLEFTDLDATKHSVRFYRIVTPWAASILGELLDQSTPKGLRPAAAASLTSGTRLPPPGGHPVLSVVR